MNKSIQAQAAAAIRKELKEAFPQYKFRVTSDSGSMTTSVSIQAEDVHPEDWKEIKTICDKYQYGKFDGMTDSYEYTNANDDLPQVKWVQPQNNMSDDMKQAVYKFLRQNHHSFNELLEEYALEQTTYIEDMQDRVCSIVRREYHDETSGFWNQSAETESSESPSNPYLINTPSFHENVSELPELPEGLSSDKELQAIQDTIADTHRRIRDWLDNKVGIHCQHADECMREALVRDNLDDRNGFLTAYIQHCVMAAIRAGMEPSQVKYLVSQFQD